MIIDISPEPANVISLSIAREKYRPGACAHRSMIVDEELNEVICKACGAKLNPVAMLARFATEESRWTYQLKEMRAIKKKLEEKSRCKCEHCNRFTRVRP